MNEFQEALEEDVCPSKSVEGIFGIRMGQGPDVEVKSHLCACEADLSSAFPSTSTHSRMRLGDVVYAAWVTLSKNGMFRRNAILAALALWRVVGSLMLGTNAWT